MRRKLARYAELDRSRNTGKLEVVVDKGDDQRSEASIPGTDHKWSSEERGPSPLAYFLSSMAMCQCVHYAEHAAAEGVRIDSLRIVVEGTYNISHPRSFEEIRYTTYVQSPEDQERIRQLVHTAVDDCYVTGTIKRACKLDASVVLNGAPM